MKKNYMILCKTISKKNMYVWAILAASFFCINTSNSQTLMYNQGFENTLDGWSKSSMSSVSYTTNRVRTGTTCFDMVSGTSKGYSTYSTTFTSGTYVHIIGWVASTNASQQLYWSLNGTSGDAASVSTTYSRLTYKTNGTAGYNYTGTTGSKNVRLYLNVIPTTGDSIYLDDVVLYSTTSNVPTDLVKPESPTTPLGSTASISWINGTDGTGTEATGVQATLIFHRTAGVVGDGDLILNDQGQYPANNVLDNWTLVTSTVESTATSYSGTFTFGDEYAIVHRDLAYNYSAPTYVTISSSTDIHSPGVSTGKTYSAAKSIIVEGNAGATVSVFGLDGAPLYSGVVSSSKEELPILLNAGIYVVRINGQATKVFVK